MCLYVYLICVAKLGQAGEARRAEFLLGLGSPPGATLQCSCTANFQTKNL